MGKYDDAIGSIELKVSVKEVLDEASSNEVDKKLKEKQKNREQEVKIKISAEDALKDLERLNKAAKDTKKNLENAVSSGKGFNVIKRYETSMGAIKQQMEALPDSIKKNNKLYKESQTIFKDTDKILKKLTVTQKELNATQKDNVGTKSTAKKSEKALEKQIELTEQQNKISEVTTKAMVDGAKKQAKAQTEVAKAIVLTEKQMESAIKRYNKWMSRAGYEHRTIGLDFDDGYTKGWNLRDMVSEAYATIGNMRDIGEGNGTLSQMRAELNGLQSFINAYEKHIGDMQTTLDHGYAGELVNKYDNTLALKEQQKIIESTTKSLERQGKVYKTISVQKDNTFIKNENLKKLAVHATTEAIEDQIKARKKVYDIFEISKLHYDKEIASALKENPNIVADLSTQRDELIKQLQPVKDLKSEISSLSREGFPNSLDGLKNAAAEVAKQLSVMYDEGIDDTKEYVALQFKLKNLLDQIGGSYGGVSGSGARDGVQLHEWIYNSIFDTTGYDIRDGSAIDALWGQGLFSIYETNSKTRSMLELAGELLDYQGYSLSGGFGAKEDERMIKNINDAIKAIQNFNPQKYAIDKEKDAFLLEYSKNVDQAIRKTESFNDKWNELYNNISNGSLTAAQALEQWGAYVDQQKQVIEGKTGAKKEFYEMSRQDATNYLFANYDEKLWNEWFLRGFDSARTEIAKRLENDPALKNASLNQMWHVFKEQNGSDISYDDFLNSKIPLYRGERAIGLDGSLAESVTEFAASFSLSADIAKDFAGRLDSTLGNVLETFISPKDTLGMPRPKNYGETGESYGEIEVLVPMSKIYNSPEYLNFKQQLKEKQERYSTDKDVKENKKLIASYEELCQVVERLNGLEAKDIHRTTDEDYKYQSLSNQLHNTIEQQNIPLVKVWDTLKPGGLYDVDKLAELFDFKAIEKEENDIKRRELIAEDVKKFSLYLAENREQINKSSDGLNKYNLLMAEIAQGALTAEDAISQLNAKIAENNTLSSTVVGISQPTTPKGITVDSLAEYKSSFSDKEMKSILKGIDINAIAKTFNIIGEERQVLAEELKTLASMTAEMTAGKFDSNLYDKQYQKVEQMIISNGKNAIQNEKKFEKFLNYIGDSVIKYTDTDAKELTPDEWQPILKRFGVAKGKQPALISQDIGRAVDSFYDEMIDTVGEVGYLKREITNSHQRFKAVVQTLELAYDEKSTHRKNEYKSLDQSDRQEIGGEIGLFLGKAYDNAAKMSEETLKVEQKITKEKEGQIGLIENTAKKTKEQAKAEKEAAKAAAELAKRKEKVNNLLGVGLAEEVSIDEFVRQGVNKSIEQLRNSDNSGKNVINFKGVFNGEDLLDQVNDAVHKITKQTNFEIDKFNIGKSDASFKLINQETGFAIEQTYRLKDATEELGYATIEVTNRISGSMTAARKNLTGLISEYNKIDLEKQKASLSGQDTSIYDREQEITLTKIINLLDLVELSEKEQIELKKIDNQLIQQKAKLIETAAQKKKQAQEEISKITNNVSQQINEWTSKGFFGKTLSSGKLVDGVFSSDLQNEINNFQSSLSHLDENSDLPKIKKQWEDVSAKARDAIKANQEYSNSFYKNEFQNNYKYANGKTAQDQTKFDSMRDFYNTQEQDAQKFNNNIKCIYNEIMLTMKQMNSLDSGINSLTLKDNGSGLYDKSIATLQEKKSALVATMRTLNAEINTMFDMPKENYGIPTLLEEARKKAILTNEEIDKLDDLFRQADKASYDFAATLTSKIQPTIEKLASLKQMAIDGKITNSDDVGSILSMEGTLKSKMANFNKYEDASSASEVLKYNSAISEQVTLLDQLARKEAQYFAGKTQYKQNTTMSTLAKETEEQANKVSDAQNKLKKAANQFAKESGASGAIVTNFVQGADGIAKLDFSVLDTGTNSVRKFRMEMGSLTDSTYVTETAVKNSMSGIQAGVKQLESVSNLIQKLNLSGVDTSDSSAAVTNLLNVQQKLNAELSKGTGTSETTITKLANDAKLSVAEVQKLYNQMQKVQSIAKGNGGYKLDGINLNEDAYTEMTNSVKNFAKSFPDSTLSIGKFNEAAGTLDFSLVKANGSATTFKATMESMSGTVAAQRTGVKQVNTALDTFAKTAKHAGRELVTAFVGYNVFFKVVSEIRKGIGYVKQIDLAMTELKKVTDETEETYDNFLKTASKTANVIGSTVSEFTEATANFARLGYSVEESAEMAKSAVVYKNVADGLDTIDESTESIISTMKAFGIESSGTMGIIDRFNEVGKCIAQII